MMQALKTITNLVTGILNVSLKFTVMTDSDVLYTSLVHVSINEAIEPLSGQDGLT